MGHRSGWRVPLPRRRRRRPRGGARPRAQLGGGRWRRRAHEAADDPDRRGPGAQRDDLRARGRRGRRAARGRARARRSRGGPGSTAAHATAFAVTNEAGAFVVEGLDRGAYDLSAEAEGHAPARRTGIAGGARRISLVLDAGLPLAGTVTAGGGEVPAYTLLVLRPVGTARTVVLARSIVDPAGRFEVRVPPAPTSCGRPRAAGRRARRSPPPRAPRTSGSPSPPARRCVAA